jgi:anaerobic ribonucleoside-triphosphate reductase activating protein
LISARELAAKILHVKGIDGVTLSGGEPFCQAAALSKMIRLLKDRGLSVVCYSGFTLEALRAKKDAGVQALLGQVDLLIDGPYLKDRPTRKAWQGSANQRLHFLTDRFQDTVDDYANYARGFEIHIGKGGKIQVTGFPGSALEKNLDTILSNFFPKAM